MADLDAVAEAWAEWDDASPPAVAEAERAVSLAQQLARAIAVQKGEGVDATALWDWLAVRWDAWRTYDATHAADAALRAPAARGMQALLGVARNSAAQAAHTDAVLLHWDAVGDVLAYCLLFENMTDPALLPAVRTLAQLVANAATCDSALQHTIWRLHVLGEPATPSPDAVQRLLASSDTHTVLASAVFVLNCIDTSYEEEMIGPMCTPPEKASFARNVVQTPEGVRLIETLLGAYDAALLADEATKAADELLLVTVAIVQRLFKCGLFGELLNRLAPTDIHEPRVSAAQITLLRVLATYLDERLARLQNTHRPSGKVRMLSSAMQKSQRFTQSTEPLPALFCSLATYTVHTMKQHVDGHGVDDFRGLIRAHMALLAVLSCLHRIGLCAQEDVAHHETSGDTEFLARMRTPACGVAEACVDLLHESNRFFPAQNPFQPRYPAADERAAHDGDACMPPRASAPPSPTPPLPDGHVPSSTAQVYPVTDSRPALYRLKCSVLQLLGTLAFEPSGAPHLADVSALQDRVRERGGLLDTLNMTQLDEHNPYIREYAIFTLRYLLAGNVASQAQIAELRPVSPHHEAPTGTTGTVAMQ